jgi:cell division septation protein DedD
LFRLLLAAATLAFATATASAAVLEVPSDGATVSGIGFISGWKCPPNDNIIAVIDEGNPLPMASGIARGDTSTVCGNAGLNGFIAQFNFGLLGDGQHDIVLLQDGIEFASGTFTVVTFGVPFMRGVGGTYVLDDFPSSGQTTTVQWNEGTQSFVVVSTTGTAPATPSPTPKSTPKPTPHPTAKPTPTPSARPTARPTPRPTSAPACCKVCSTGKACGDSCISRSNTCHVGPGCACNG